MSKKAGVCLAVGRAAQTAELSAGRAGGSACTPRERPRESPRARTPMSHLATRSGSPCPMFTVCTVQMKAVGDDAVVTAAPAIDGLSLSRTPPPPKHICRYTRGASTHGDSTTAGTEMAADQRGNALHSTNLGTQLWDQGCHKVSRREALPDGMFCGVTWSVSQWPGSTHGARGPIRSCRALPQTLCHIDRVRRPVVK